MTAKKKEWFGGGDDATVVTRLVAHPFTGRDMKLATEEEGKKKRARHVAWETDLEFLLLYTSSS